MTAITDVRAHLTQALSGLGVPVHTYPPGTLVPPAVVLLAGAPYWAPTLLGGAQVGVTVRLLVASAAGPASTADLDELIASAASALHAAGVRVSAVEPPTTLPDGTVTVAELDTFTSWED